MADRKIFCFWEADCKGHVKKSEHDDWHLWHEIKYRLQQEFGQPFLVKSYEREDWLAQLWFRPQKTPRSSEGWMNQAQLWFNRSINSQKIYFGLEVECPPGQTQDRDADRLRALLEQDTGFCQMIDDLAEKGLQISAGHWEGKYEHATSGAELRDILNSLGTDRGWSASFGSELSCEEAVRLGEQVNYRMMDVFRLVWPLWLRVLPEAVRAAMEGKAKPKPVNGDKKAKPVKTDPSIIAPFAAYLSAHNFYFPPDLLTTYYLSLQTKPFVILTGISGTGKTKLAQLFAEWMRPTIEKEVEQAVEIEPKTDSFTITVQPYMLKYSRIVIPVDYWTYFPILEGDEKARVRVRAKDFEEDCQLGRYPRGKGTNRDPIYWLFKGKVRDWMQNELQVGDIVEILCPADEEDPVYTLRKYERAQKQQVKVTKDYTTFISVRPDWTDNRGLLGFYNLITGAYQTTDFLRLLVQAAIEDDQPHFVILDEMNLAKVEYYFADFLSVLESRYLQDGELKQERLRLHDLPRCVLAQGEAPWDEMADPEAIDQHLCRVRCGACPLRDGVDEAQRARGESDYEDARKSGFEPLRYVPPRMVVPRNVYFSGTVNVDETTYMFSPKVLDRANTIEFNAVDLGRYFAEETTRGGAALPAGEATRAAFTFDGAFVQLPKEAPLRTEPFLAPYRERLRDLNARLQPHMLHFGYRVADEILLYLWNAYSLNDPDFGLDVAFDYQIYQKVLPKFHGSEAKLKEPLTVVREFCENHGYTRSLAKIAQMLDALRKEGFASFA